MILTNIENVPGKRIVKHLGLVQGSTVRAKNVGRDIFASIKNIFGGELKGYTELMSESRKEASKRMKKQASKVGANAVVNVRFATSSIAQGAAELFVYGTAVVVEDIVYDGTEHTVIDAPLAQSGAQPSGSVEAPTATTPSAAIDMRTSHTSADPDAAYRKPEHSE